ncbi:MAG TPA: sugar phosphate nucleotidyltransferase, partial [Longimicrobium sp.]|nr:sugar phosphate nucleotidyltransferase [Longimicrobium sp.]
MKVAILAGGFGTRLQEETTGKPKPMVEVGGRPILWHIMKTYHAHDFRDFVLLLGYKSEVIKDYFYNYRRRASDLTVNTKTGDMMVHEGNQED